jgi:hypothetical protein
MNKELIYFLSILHFGFLPVSTEKASLKNKTKQYFPLPGCDVLRTAG